MEKQYNLLKEEFEAYKRGVENKKLAEKIEILKPFIEVIDDVEEGLKLEPNDGINLLYRNLCEAMKSNGLKRYGKRGDKFNPDFFESRFWIDEKPSEYVRQVLKSGWVLDGEIIRHCIVAL